MKKRAIMISMLLVMALSVTGCSQKTATKDKDTKTEETAKTDDAEETESDNTEDTSEDTPTTAELMLCASRVLLIVFLYHSYLTPHIFCLRLSYEYNFTA